MRTIRQSFDRARRGRFAEHFYALLLEQSEAIRGTFRNTDFDRQRDLFVHGVYSILDYAEGKPLGRMAIERLAATHGPGGLRVGPAMLDTWTDCFIEALGQSDPELDDSLAKKWRETLAIALNRMRAAHPVAARARRA
jgi:hypothetical protein